MIGVVRNIWATRLAALAVLLAVLIQAALGLPVTLRMAAGTVPICGAPQAAHGNGTPAQTPHDHAHCLLCQASAAPPLAANAPPLPLPASAVWASPQHVATAEFGLRPAPIGFSSRAPPTTA